MIHRKRLTLLAALAFGSGATLIGRAGLLQVMTDERLEKLANRQFQSRMLVKPRRGMILDRVGEPLAINVATHSLAANPSKIPDRRIAAKRVSQALGVDANLMQKRMKSGKEFLWIKRDLGEVKLSQLRKWGLSGTGTELDEAFWLVREEKRVYPHGGVAAQVLGTTNVDGEGIEGVEQWKNSEMRGTIASVRAVRDALGRPAFLDVADAKESKDGVPVRLTLDASLQFGAEQLVKDAVLKTRSRSGLALVMDARSGEILVMSQYPVFDPNRRSEASEHRRNRAVTDGFEPGSTLKAFLLASAVSGKWKLSDRIWGGRGEVVIQGKRIGEAEAHEKFEWLSLEQMIEVSSNVVAAKLALDVGSDRFIPFLRELGLGTRSGLGFPGEITGRIPTEQGMKPLSLANIGFGQGLVVTPLQMLRAYAAIANGGILPEPRLFTEEAKDVKNGKPIPPKRVFSPLVAEMVTRALRAVVEKGTGGKAALEGYVVAGKTGTAQVVDPRTRQYSRSHYIASFAGFPVLSDAKPLPVIYTWLDGPQGVYYASETAAPLFKEVLALVVNRFGIPATAPTRLAAEPPRKPEVSEPPPVLAEEKPMGPAPASGFEENGSSWRVPSLVGLTPREALRVMEGKPIEPRLTGFGLVRSQFPTAGSLINEGQTLSLQLGD